jgi:hypothetical protein
MGAANAVRTKRAEAKRAVKCIVEIKLARTEVSICTLRKVYLCERRTV